MKKTLLIAALTMAAAPAFASKARLNALQGAAHLVDTQNDFEQPWQVAANGELATVEFGAVGYAAPNAEGGFVRQWNDAYVGLYLGHRPATMVSLLGTIGFSAAGATGVYTTPSGVAALNNPLNIFYAAKAGDITWGANLFYLSTNSKGVNFGGGSTADADVKSNVMGLSVGATNGTWDASVTLGLAGKAEATMLAGADNAVSVGGVALTGTNSGDITAKSNMSLIAGYKADTLYYYLGYGMAGAKATANGTDGADVEVTSMKLGVINSHKKDGADFFYGIAYATDSAKEKNSGAKSESTNLPVIVGVEADANSWLVMRGSLTQNIGLLSSSKPATATGSGDATAAAESTKVAAGLGAKFNKFTIDAQLATAGSGTFGFDGANFLANTSLTYNF